MGIDLAVTSGAIATVLNEAAHAHPNEACGLLLGRAGRIERAVPTANVAADPLRHFEIDPAALIAAHRAARAGGAQVMGYFHSHPNGRRDPSETDRANASGDGLVWAIAANSAVLLWRDGPQGFAPLPYRVAEG
ncbi:MAG: M67 family metallopeptidase [Novosphingobium sp.]